VSTDREGDAPVNLAPDTLARLASHEMAIIGENDLTDEEQARLPSW